MLVAFIILCLGFFSVNEYSVGIITNQSNIRLISIESLYRIIFNPLWAISLWFYEKGLRLNAERHSNILQNIQGALDSSGEYIKTGKIYEIIYKHDDAEKRMEERFKKEDTIKNEINNPNPVV